MGKRALRPLSRPDIGENGLTWVGVRVRGRIGTIIYYARKRGRAKRTFWGAARGLREDGRQAGRRRSQNISNVPRAHDAGGRSRAISAAGSSTSMMSCW